MLAAQTLALREEAAGNEKGSRLLAINVASRTRFLSSLRVDVPFSAVSVLARIAPRKEPSVKFSRSLGKKGNTEKRLNVDAWQQRTALGIATMAFETIQLEERGAVSVITLNRPESLNALTTKVGADFLAAVTQAKADGARAIVLTGAGRAFCAGGDLREMRSMAESNGKIEAFFDEPLRLLNECILAIRRTPIPFIAAVNGAASGGGCNLALACDLVMAGESARFNQAFIKIGLVPDCGGSFILPRLVGWKRAAELMMTGDVVAAGEALEMGMINAVVPDTELMAQAMAMAEKLAQAPTAAIGRIKKLMEASATNNYEEQLELERELQIQSGLTQDFKEGVGAFLEKRAAKFVGG